MDAIDLFAGAGGFSMGAEAAGCRVVWAADIWPLAVKYHTANHPHTAHSTQDLHRADWTEVPTHQLLLAAPSCQGHSSARGKDRPHHDAQRSTAWAVVSAVEYHRPEVAIVENVPEFSNWMLYPAWSAAMTALGYSIAPHVIDAADHGVPQHRRRLFLVCTRSRTPLQLKLIKHPHVAAAAILNFEVGDWTPVRCQGRAARTLARFEVGRATHGRRFLLPYYGTARGGRSVARPLGTVTTSGNHHALVDGDRMRMLVVDEVRAAMGFPANYVLPAQRTAALHLMGNAVCPPVAADLITAVLQEG